LSDTYISAVRQERIKKAAPELLEALKEIEEQFGYCLPNPYRARMQAAIAKAEGKDGE
jgi:hypothetical protein